MLEHFTFKLPIQIRWLEYIFWNQNQLLGLLFLVLRVRTSHSQTMNSQNSHFWAKGFTGNPVAQKLLVTTSNSQTMHSLTTYAYQKYIQALSAVWRPTSFKQCHMMNGNLWPQTHFKVESQKWICGYIQKTFTISSHMLFQSIGLNYWCPIAHSKTCKFEVWTITTTTYTLPTKNYIKAF